MLCGGTLTEDAGDEDVVGAADVNALSNDGVFPLAEGLDGVKTRSGPHAGGSGDG